MRRNAPRFTSWHEEATCGKTNGGPASWQRSPNRTPRPGAGDLARRLCRFAVDEMALSGCAIVLMSGAESASVLAGAGRHARTVTGLQMELGEGPCLQAHAAGIPVLLPDLGAENATAGRRSRRPP